MVTGVCHLYPCPKLGASELMIRTNAFHRQTLPFRRQYTLAFIALWVDHQHRDRMSEEDHHFVTVNAAFAEFVMSKWLDAYIPTSRLSTSSRIYPADELEWNGSLHHHCLSERWAEDDCERLQMTGAEYAALYRKGGHLAGLLDLDGQAQWAVSH